MSWDILSKTNLQYLLTRLKEVTDSIVRGHTIKNSSGTSMTSRDDLKFSGYLKTTDDSTNDCTVVSDEPIPITWEDYQALTDVQRSGNKYLITDYPGGGGGGGSGALNDLTDVTISSPTNGQILQYNNTNSKWVNANLPQGGHTIITDGGTSLTQRDNLQAKGIYTHDDSTNGKTIMEVVREFNSVDDIEALTGEEAKGFQHIPDTVYKGRTASDIGFDKTGTSFNSTRVQDVLEEVDSDINGINTELSTIFATAITDLDALLTTGTAIILINEYNWNATGVPSGEMGISMTYGSGTSNYRFQFAFTYSGKIFSRSYYAGTISNWVQVSQ